MSSENRAEVSGRLQLFWRAAGVRHAVWAATLTGVLTALTVALVYWQTTAQVTRIHLRTVAEEARMLVDLAEQTSLERLALVLRPSRTDTARRFAIIDGDGRLAAGDLSPDEIPFHDHGRDQPAAAVRRLGADAGSDAHASAPFGIVRLPVAGGGALLLARPMDEIVTLSERLRVMLAAVLAAIIATSGVAAWLIARANAARVGKLAETGREIMSGNLSRRLQLSARNDEVDELARTVNRMLERIEALMASIREVSDNVAHDLRTPLNRLRVRSESVLRDARTEDDLREGLAQAIDDADALVRTFNAMLLVARLDAGTLSDGASDAVDLGELVEGLVDLYRPLAEEEGAELECRVRESAVVVGNRQLISQAVTNLIENAIKYGRPAAPDRPFEISVEVHLQGDKPSITIGDRGRGIAPADRERVLGRFVRLDASRSTPGSGLGLSLVAAVARAHGGGLLLESNEPGLRVVLTLPAERIVGPRSSASLATTS